MNTLGAAVRTPARLLFRRRPFSTAVLPAHIHAFPDPSNPTQHLLTLLPTRPPTPALALGTAPRLPPSPRDFSPNPRFAPILDAVLARHAPHDPDVVAAAAAYAATSGAYAPIPARRSTRSTDGGGAGPSAAQGGTGGGGRGGWVHVGDARRPPDWGRVHDPEDIFGSVEVDARGRVLEGGYQASGTYRIVTRDGMLVDPRCWEGGNADSWV
jgi:hypothetical protein